MLILASGSAARRTLMEKAGLCFTIYPAAIDERAVMPQTPAAIAQAKALSVSEKFPGAVIIGVDQMMMFNGHIHHKSATRAAARAVLQKLREQTHVLDTAVCVARNEKILWSHKDRACLTMKDFDDYFLELYMDRAGPALTSCVGGYEFEGAGLSLFEHTDGALDVIMGLPLVPLLSFLVREGLVSP